jgi:hypothetical protein
VFIHKLQKRFNDLRNEVTAFLEVKERDGAEIKCTKWFQHVTFLFDILNQLYWLNILLQGKRKRTYI